MSVCSPNATQFPWSALLDADYGVPLGLAAEAANGSFVRHWSKADVFFDCNRNDSARFVFKADDAAVHVRPRVHLHGDRSNMETSSTAVPTASITLSIAPTPIGTSDGGLFGLTAVSSSFIMAPTPNAARIKATRDSRMRTILRGLSPELTIGVGGTFTDFTTMPGPAPGVSPMNVSCVAGMRGPCKFSAEAWAAVNEMATALPEAKLVVSLSGLLRSWTDPKLPVSDLPCNIRREGGESLVIGGSSLVILKGKA